MERAALSDSVAVWLGLEAMLEEVAPFFVVFACILPNSYLEEATFVCVSQHTSCFFVASFSDSIFQRDEGPETNADE